jgi:hypothetical protein
VRARPVLLWRMRFPRTAAVLVAACLALVPAPAQAGRETVQDTTASDVPHQDIDMTSLTVTYNSKGAVAKLRFKDLRKAKRLRLFVQFYNQPNDDQFSPRHGNFLELRINDKGKIKRVNWVFGPDDAFDGYHAEKCRGVKIKPDFDKDVITYKLPNRCTNFLDGRGYIVSYASTRRFKPSHWDDGDPAATTGDWFDTTPGLVVEQ